MGRPNKAFAVFKWLFGGTFIKSRLPFSQGMGRFGWARKLFSFRFEQHTATIIMALIVGVLSSSAVIVFHSTLVFIHNLVFIRGQTILHITHELDTRALLPLLPMLGSLMLIPLKWKFPGEVGGYGFPNFMVNVNLKGGKIRLKSVLMKIIAPAITIGTGGSAGVEGPAAIIGGGVGSMISRWLGFSEKRTTLFIAAGSAGAIASIFNAPIAGVMFSTEIILLGNYEMMSFGAVVISAGMATAVSRAYFGANPMFTVPLYDVGGIAETPFYIIFGFFISFISVSFIKTFYKIKELFGELGVHRFIKPVIGAFLVGIIGIYFPQVLSDGYDSITEALNSNFPIQLLFILIGLKILATSLTIGSGGAGGVFAPSLFIGAMAGGFFGLIVHSLFPHITSVPGTYATIGIGTFLAAATHAPLTGIFLLFEMTGNYKLVIPIMFSSISATFMASRLYSESIDTAELSRLGIDLMSGRETSILQQMKIKDIMNNKTFTTIHESDPLTKVADTILHGREMYFPVLNDSDELVGIISMQDIRAVFMEERIKQVVTAGEIATEDVITIRDVDNMITALELFSLKDIDEIPVVDFLNTKHVIGMLKRVDVMSAYNKEVLKRQAGKTH